MAFPILLLWLLALPAAVQILRGLRLIVVPVAPEAVTRRVLRTVAEALEAGHPVTEDLERQLVHLPALWAWRLRKAIRPLRAGTAPGIMAALGAQRLLPRVLRADAVAAEQAGLPVLAAWCRAASTTPTWEDHLQRLWATLGVQILLLSVAFSFLGVVILPKFQQIGKELGMPLDPRLEALGWWPDLVRLPFLLPLVALVLSLGLAQLSWWAGRRQFLGRALLTGVAQGLTESHLAVLAGQGMAARTAASHGDFPAIAAAAGFPQAADPQALASAVDQHRDRLRRRCLVIATLADVLVPLLLAIPVALVAMGLFGTLTSIITRLGEHVP